MKPQHYYVYYEGGKLWLDGIRKRLKKPSQLSLDVIDAINVYYGDSLPDTVRGYIVYAWADHKRFAQFYKL